jgi:hypothetical protein
MIDPLIVRAVSLALGLLLIGAAWHKLASGRQFAAVVEDYRLLPRVLAPSIARTLPALEVLLGLGWISGIVIPMVAPATAVMFGIYTLAIAINLLRGRVHISCGCGLGGATNENQPLSWVLVLRNLLLMAASLMPLAPVIGRSLGLMDWFVLSLALLAAGILYVAASQLLRNQAGIRSWRSARD